MAPDACLKPQSDPLPLRARRWNSVAVCISIPLCRFSGSVSATNEVDSFLGGRHRVRISPWLTEEWKDSRRRPLNPQHQPATGLLGPPSNPNRDQRSAAVPTGFSSYKNGRRAELLGIYFFFSFFCFRFSFRLSWAFFCCSLLPLSFFPLSPISVSPCLNRDFPSYSSQPPKTVAQSSIGQERGHSARMAAWIGASLPCCLMSRLAAR